MERNYIHRLSCINSHSQRSQQEVNYIVDDPKSSNPHSLLPWLKRQLQTFALINNPDYNSTSPTAS